MPLFEEETALYYAESFEEACALVADGTRDGCLVPFMGEDRLPLSGIVRLIDEYDLKKCRRYLIDNGNQNTVYLLLCKEAHLLPDADTMELLVEGVREQIDRLLALSEDCRLKVSLPEPLQGLSSPASRSASSSTR